MDMRSGLVKHATLLPHMQSVEGLMTKRKRKRRSYINYPPSLDEENMVIVWHHSDLKMLLDIAVMNMMTLNENPTNKQSWRAEEKVSNLTNSIRDEDNFW